MNTILKITLVGLVITFTSCKSTEEKKKEAEEEGNALVSIKAKLLKGAGDALKDDGKEAAEAASEGIGEVIKGIYSGYDKSINQAEVLADSTFYNTFEIGRTEKLYSDTADIKKVTIYLIANNPFEGKLKLKAFDQEDTEIGRSKVMVKMEEDDANFYDFIFDNRTPLLQASYFIIEK